MKLLRSFPPVADRRSRVLILGSMPGPEALRRRQYYGFPGNQFWRLVADLLGRPKPGAYEERLRMLREGRIALWDTLMTCVRPSALDSRIRRPVPNDVPALLRGRPGIQAVFVNGHGAETFFRRYFAASVGLPVFYLPSSSPANASLSYEAKLERWKAVLPWLREGLPLKTPPPDRKLLVRHGGRHA